MSRAASHFLLELLVHLSPALLSCGLQVDGGSRATRHAARAAGLDGGFEASILQIVKLVLAHWDQLTRAVAATRSKHLRVLSQKLRLVLADQLARLGLVASSSGAGLCHLALDLGLKQSVWLL